MLRQAAVRCARSRRPRSSLRSRTPTSRTPSQRARRVGVRKANDRRLAPRWPRERSCDAHREHEVRAFMHMGRGPTMAAHLRSRPTPTTACPSSEAIKDRAPLKHEEPGRRGSGFPSPDTPAGQKLITTASARHWCKAGGLRGRNFERTDVTSLKDDLRCGCIMRERLADGDHGV